MAMAVTMSQFCLRATATAVNSPQTAAAPAAGTLGQNSFASFSGLRSLGTARRSSSAYRSKAPSAQGVRAATAVGTKFKTLQPLGDRVLVKSVQAEEKSVGGILLPTTAQGKSNGGQVVAVGDGRSVGDKKVPVAVKAGAKVLYSKYAGTEVEFNDETHLILKEDDIIGLMNSDDVKDITPTNDRVLVKVAEAEEKTAGGVLLTDSAKEKPVIGSVAAVGPGGLDEQGNRKPLDIAVGNTVLYAKYAGAEFKTKDEKQYVVLRAQDIMAVLS